MFLSKTEQFFHHTFPLIYEEHYKKENINIINNDKLVTPMGTKTWTKVKKGILKI